MIPVRIAANYIQMEQIADMTAKFYEQEAVMFYELSSNVTIKEYPEFAPKQPDPIEAKV